MSNAASQTLALIIGGAYFDLQPDAAGAFTRGGVIFASMLTSALDTFGEVRLPRAILSFDFSCVSV